MKAPWRNLTGLSKAMAILATIACIAFGLCSANLIFLSDGDGHGAIRGFFNSAGAVAGSVVMLCLVGMLIVGVIAIIEAIMRSRRPPN
jgi:hypothetical protein